MPLQFTAAEEKVSNKVVVDYFYKATLDIPVALIWVKPFVSLINFEKWEEYIFSLKAYGKIEFSFIDNLQARLKLIISSLIQEMMSTSSPEFGSFELLTFQFVLDKKLIPVLIRVWHTISLHSKRTQELIKTNSVEPDDLIMNVLKSEVESKNPKSLNSENSENPDIEVIQDEDEDCEGGYELLFTSYSIPKTQSVELNREEERDNK